MVIFVKIWGVLMVNISLAVLAVLFGFMSSTAQASLSPEQYQQQVASNLRGLSTDELVGSCIQFMTLFAKALNKQSLLFFEVAAKTIVDEMLNRDDWTSMVWQTKYGYRKGLLRGLRGRIGNDAYCNCIYSHIMKGDSGCLNQ